MEEKIYFIRHKLHSLVPRLEKERRIAIIYENMPFDSVYVRGQGPTDFFLKNKKNKTSGFDNKGYETSLKYFDELNRKGGYVFAEYGESPSQFYIGKVNPNKNKIEPFSDLQVTIKLSDVRSFSYSDFPVLLAVRPPYGTLCVPKRKTFTIIADYIFSKKIPELSLDLLHPQMAEQMCVEYLQKVGIKIKSKNIKLDYSILRPGKTAATIDVAGRLEDNKVIFAQIKNGVISERDINNFYKFMEDETNKIGVIFHHSNNREYKDIPANIVIVDIQGVFAYFLKNNRKFIEDLVGISFI